jgi:hypothetical protein
VVYDEHDDFHPEYGHVVRTDVTIA